MHLFRPPRLRPPAVTPAGVRRAADAATVAVFLLGLAVPLGGFLLRTPVPPTTENRPLNPMPPVKLKKWAVVSFPGLFEPYFNDRVGFREVLLDWRRRVVFDLLGDSPTDVAWVGTDGWLYLNPSGRLGGLPAAQPPVEPNLDAWAAALVDRRAYLADRGIRYLVLVVPDKHSVYPEHLPAEHRRHPPPDLVAPLRERLAGSGVELLDAGPAILRAKAEGGRPVYFRTDSHWTDAGAFAAYRELAAAVARHFPHYRAKEVTAFAVVPHVWEGCDLPGNLGLPPDQRREPHDGFAEPNNPGHKLPADGLTLGPGDGPPLQHMAPHLFETPTAAGPRAVFVHDSFGPSLFRLAHSDFRRLACVGTYSLPAALIDRERPEVVIQVMVERTFRLHVPANPPAVGPRSRTGRPSS